MSAYPHHSHLINGSTDVARMARHPWAEEAEAKAEGEETVETPEPAFGWFSCFGCPRITAKRSPAISQAQSTMQSPGPLAESPGPFIDVVDASWKSSSSDKGTNCAVSDGGSPTMCIETSC